MTARRSDGRARHAVHLIFREDLDDSASIRELLLAVRPDLRVQARPRPTSLQRGAGRPALDRSTSNILDAVAGTERRGQPTGSVLVHRDVDVPDPSGFVHDELARQLSFPEAVEAVRPTAWKGNLPWRQQDVEKIARPYEELVRRTRGTSEYARADAPSVAARIRELQLNPRGRSASYTRLIDLAARLK